MSHHPHDERPRIERGVVYSRAQLAAALGVSERTVARAVDAGRLPAPVKLRSDLTQRWLGDAIIAHLGGGAA